MDSICFIDDAPHHSCSAFEGSFVSSRLNQMSSDTRGAIILSILQRSASILIACIQFCLRLEQSLNSSETAVASCNMQRCGLVDVIAVISRTVLIDPLWCIFDHLGQLFDITSFGSG